MEKEKSKLDVVKDILEHKLAQEEEVCNWLSREYKHGSKGGHELLEMETKEIEVNAQIKVLRLILEIWK